MKRCPDCGQIKPAAEFGRNRSFGDGLSFYCRDCNRARSNEHYRERRAALGKKVRHLSWVPDGFRWCPTCEQAVPVEDYIRNSAAALYVEGHAHQDANQELQAAAMEAASRPGTPPVGSQRRPGSRGTNPRTTGRSSGTRRRQSAGEADT